MKFSLKFNKVYTRQYSSEVEFFTLSREDGDIISGILYKRKHFNYNLEKQSSFELKYITKNIDRYNIIYYNKKKSFYYIEKQKDSLLEITPVFISLPENYNKSKSSFFNTYLDIYLLPTLLKEKFIKIRKLSDSEMLDVITRYGDKIGDYIYSDMFGKKEKRNIFIEDKEYYLYDKDEESHILSMYSFSNYYRLNNYNMNHSYILISVFDNIYNKQDLEGNYYLNIYRRFLENKFY